MRKALRLRAGLLRFFVLLRPAERRRAEVGTRGSQVQILPLRPFFPHCDDSCHEARCASPASDIGHSLPGLLATGSPMTSLPSNDQNPFAAGSAFADGKFVPIAEASISILDWGFLHSDATYDVAHVWKGSFFRLEDHLDRFEHSMARLRMRIPHDRAA